MLPGSSSLTKLRPISALNNKEGIKNYPELINQKSNLKPYLVKTHSTTSKNKINNNNDKNHSLSKNNKNLGGTIKIINHINNISTLNYNNPNSSVSNNSQLIPLVQNNSNNNFSQTSSNFNFNSNQSNFKYNPKTLMSLSDVNKLSEECNNYRNTANKQAQEIIELKSQLQKKELEISKNYKLYSKVINDNNLQDSTSIANINSIKENQLIGKLKQQFNEIKEQLKIKELQIEEIKKTIKYTKIQEVLADNLYLKEELEKSKTHLSGKIVQDEKLIKENSLLRETNNKLINEISLLQDKNSKLDSKVESLVSSLDKKEKEYTSF